MEDNNSDRTFEESEEQEKACLERARSGDDEAFGEVVQLYERAVYNLCYRMLGDPVEAEDAAQEAFIRAYTRLGTYDPERKFSSWMLAIASHHCIDRLRKRRFKWLSWDDLPPWRWLHEGGSESPEERAIRRETGEQVQDMLEKLPPDYRAAVVLRYWYEFSYEEIAESLDTTVSAIKSRLFRARKMLAEVETAPPVPQANSAPVASRPGFERGMEI
jgi:RNA polymerase sigma-70 factor (ECF subfamily)